MTSSDPERPNSWPQCA